MSRAKLIIVILFIFAVIGGIIAALALQQRQVTITTTTPVELFSGERKVTTVNDSSTIALSDGEYCAVAIDNKYTKDKECFMVYKKDREVSLVVDLSKEELSTQLDTEIENIKGVITAQYRSIINQFTTCRGELLQDGSWYGGILRDKVASPADNSNYYYFIMHKNGSGWSITTTPSVVISKYSPQVKDVPEKIINKVNLLTPCEVEVSENPSDIPTNIVDRFEVDNDRENY